MQICALNQKCWYWYHHIKQFLCLNRPSPTDALYQWANLQRHTLLANVILRMTLATDCTCGFGYRVHISIINDAWMSCRGNYARFVCESSRVRSRTESFLDWKLSTNYVTNRPTSMECGYHSLKPDFPNVGWLKELENRLHQIRYRRPALTTTKTKIPSAAMAAVMSSPSHCRIYFKIKL